MKIYVCHSTNFDYQNDLYRPIKDSLGKNHEVILPHENGDDFNSKNVIETSDVIVAEVSYSSTGQGVEIGWADSANVPIICIYKSDTKPSEALRHIAKTFIEYNSEKEMVKKLTQALS